RWSRSKSIRMGPVSIARGSRAKGERFSYLGDKRIKAKWGKLFWCPVCGYEAHADFNASVNVHHSFYREWHWRPCHAKVQSPPMGGGGT
ncbi:MAG TPA: zinc ribbon domain-containing protein, partial [Ktedonobacteraceae bacterium]|nr:zinc ribbon domain-containing protein [Ktedonobacteraceae bacterium]